MESIAIERSIWINASRERVWKAITDAEQIATWFAPGTKFVSTGSEVGARLYVEDPETGAELYVQVLEVYDAPNRLITRTQAEPPDPAFYTSYQLEEENGGTRLTFIHGGYEGLPTEMRQQLVDQNAAGFELMLGNIKAFVEGKPLPRPEGF